ncbi:MAG: class I SAM-dependent methyltransferase [Janthinobacterium lividum]
MATIAPVKTRAGDPHAADALLALPPRSGAQLPVPPAGQGPADALLAAAAAGLQRGLGSVRRGAAAAAFMSPRDIALFVRSARTDAAIRRARAAGGDPAAFDAAYATGDPWASADPRYLYQRRKYDVLVGLLPPGRRFGRVLDVGAGLGLLARRIAARADTVTGLDISQEAVSQAAALHADTPNLRFEQGDLRSLPAALDGSFDLVVLADTLYYLPQPLSDATLDDLALRVASLLAPGGLCLLANHFFFAADPDSRTSRRIHRAFARCLDQVSEHRRPFYLVSVLTTRGT